MKLKSGQIWYDTTNYYSVRIVKVNGIQVSFRVTSSNYQTTWLISDFLKDAIYCEHETVKLILKRYR